MSHNISVAPCKKFITVKVTGPVTRETSMQFNLEAHALGKELGIHSYLVDLTESRNTDTVASNFRWANEDMRTEGIDRFARAALVVDPEDHSHDFVVVAGQNAGINLSLFTDRSLAERYLKGE